MAEKGKVFTIGYAGIALPQFIDTLKKHEITHLIDVRSVAKSQYFSAFNDTNIKPELQKYDIKYLHFKNEFGARQDNLQYYTNEIMDFEKFSQSEQFKDGIEKVKKMLSENNNICLMCAEIDPINCHRAILVARHLPNVTHIIAKRNGEINFESHKDIEKRLLDLYKKQTDILQIAYQKHNSKIGFKK
jgi:uncharacterized protein (DUF488 family)